LINVLKTKKLKSTEQLDVYLLLCRCYNNNDNEKLLFYAKKAISIAEKEDDKSYASQFNMIFGQLYLMHEKYDSAIIYYNKSIACAEQANNKDLLGGAYSMISSVFTALMQDDIALEYLLKALPCLEHTNRRKYGQALEHIGQIYRGNNNFEKAIEYLEQAKVIAEEVNFPNSKIGVYYNLGVVYKNNKEIDKALEYALKSFEISIEHRNNQYEIITACFISQLYVMLNNNDKAYNFAQLALKKSEEFGEKRLMIASMDALSRVYFYQKKYKDCDVLSRKAWEMDTLNLGIGHNLINRLALANAALENLDDAVYFSDKAMEMLDMRYKEQNLMRITELEVKYETEKKELRIAALEKDKKLYRWFGVAGGIILLLAFGVLFFRHRLNVQKRKLLEQQHELSEQKVKQLEQEKQLIATQAVLEGETAERSRLARDLHDGLGGMLSVVKLNLKDMKHFGVMDGADIERFGTALDMLDQSIGELRRVAHHIMPESLMRYGLKVSLEDFCHAIQGAHFQYLGEDPRLDSRLEILIYRCAYELVNNALKHAQAAHINVQLMIDNGVVSLTVQDDGIGFDPKTVHSGIGLENIRTRIAVYNGKMNIHSSSNAGTEISIEIES
jgi:signal transduction histidine kinase